MAITFMLGLWPISSSPRSDTVVAVGVPVYMADGIADSADRVGDGDPGVVHAAAGMRTAARTAAAIGRFTVPPCI
ncbi:hypothetical protein Psi02_69500 [Planotetraspora silvatica]|uniref:Uncharacterized protein n=1 Tax=Planotetraspora silvatica TaxID=234614 RepID=A0A8J3XSH7_9ACTN|nr:hypothetical protein Psi02_69500 [Planotetraspora silvatica]